MQISELPWYAYAFIAVVVIVFVAQLVFKARGTVKQLVRAGKSYRKSDNPSTSPAELFALAVGAINGEQLTANTDSLTTGLDKSRVVQGLSEAWGVHSPAEARDVVDLLLTEGHRGYYDEALALSRTDKGTWKTTAANAEDPEKLLEYAENLKDTEASIRDSGLDSGRLAHGILAWDLGRAINVARMSVDAGYMSNEHAWAALKNAANQAQQAFHSWNELAHSYIVGRAMWGGEGMMLDGLIGVTKGLLSDAESPWVKLRWPS